jgi:uncharacterized small protein (DUF1192 family)
MTPTVEQIVAELRARIAILRKEAKAETGSAHSCEHSAQELESLLFWITEE